MDRGYSRAQRAAARVQPHPKGRSQITGPGVLVLVRNRMGRWQMQADYLRQLGGVTRATSWLAVASSRTASSGCAMCWEGFPSGQPRHRDLRCANWSW